MPLSQQDRETLAYTLLGEAGGEGRRGMEAVAWTIRNRSESGRYSSNPAAVATQPLQYSTWNRGEGGNNPTGRYSRNSSEFQNALKIVDDVFSGRVPDPTNGATHFYAPRGMEGGRAPNWWDSELRIAGGQPIRIGGHIFAGGNALDAVNQMAGVSPRTALAYAGAPSRDVAPVPPLRPEPTPAQSSGLSLINSAQGSLANLAKRNSPPALAPMPSPITSGSRGGSLNTESTTLSDPRWTNPEWMTGNPRMPGIGLGIVGDPSTPRLADVGSHLAPTPIPRPDDLGVGGPSDIAPTPIPRPGSLGTRSNPMGQGVTPPPAPDRLVMALNNAFPVPGNTGTGGMQAATPPPPPVVAPLPSSFGPGLSFPSGLGMAPIQPLPITVTPGQVKGPAIMSPLPARPKNPLQAVVQQVARSIPSRPERGSAAASGGSLARDRSAGATRYWNPTEKRWISL